MRLDKLAVTSQQAVVIAMGIASDHEAGATEPEHLLMALLESKEGNLSAIIERIGADSAAIEKQVAEKVEAAPKVSSGLAMAQPIPSNRFVKVIDEAVKAAGKLGDNFATTEHLLIALSDDKGDAGKILNLAGVTRKNIEKAYEDLRGDTREIGRASCRERV